MSNEPQQDLTTHTDGADHFKILIVEDMEDTALTIERMIKKKLLGADVKIESNFDEALAAMSPPNFIEAMVLDLFEGATDSEENKKGQKIWEEIWKKKFVPVIIHTAGDCELEPPVPTDNPFVTCIIKGPNSGAMIVDYLLAVKPHMLALRKVEEEFNIVIRSVLAKTSPVIWNVTKADEHKSSELIVRSARRRLAAAMDMKTGATEQDLYGWEQYIYPPMEVSLLTGDILRVKDSNNEEPSTYRLVLTPSCDMQMNKGKCKAKEILVAKCVDVSRYTGSIMSALKLKKEDLPDVLPRYLSEPHQGGFIPVPEYKSIIPCMAANLRELELIPVADIDMTESTGKKLLRVVSVDSPFREYITWAYLQIIGRPGMPDRDLDTWASDIIAWTTKTASTPEAGKIKAAVATTTADDALSQDKTHENLVAAESTSISQDVKPSNSSSHSSATSTQISDAIQPSASESNATEHPEGMQNKENS
ncbi:MAG: hypothetical protein QOG00_2053 [Pyrinomonadaceae bacterium]|nr:hypothetical protein [Pyrinomonadaceae bacterium]